MADLRIPMETVQSFSTVPDEEPLDLTALRANAGTEERAVLDLIARKAGTPDVLTVGELRARPWVQAFYMRRFGGMTMEAPQH